MSRFYMLFATIYNFVVFLHIICLLNIKLIMLKMVGSFVHFIIIICACDLHSRHIAFRFRDLCGFYICIVELRRGPWSITLAYSQRIFEDRRHLVYRSIVFKCRSAYRARSCLDAFSHLYKSVCPSVGQLLRPTFVKTWITMYGSLARLTNPVECVVRFPQPCSIAGIDNENDAMCLWTTV